MGKWQILDMTSPYQEFLVEQTAETLERFRPADGIWFDMTWDQPSANAYSIAGMRRQNLHPGGEADRRLYAHRVARASVTVPEVRGHAMAVFQA